MMYLYVFFFVFLKICSHYFSVKY